MIRWLIRRWQAWRMRNAAEQHWHRGTGKATFDDGSTWTVTDWTDEDIRKALGFDRQTTVLVGDGLSERSFRWRRNRKEAA